MRFIQKGPEPPEHTAFLAAQANGETSPIRDKRPLREALAREQGHLCGYCGSPISEVDGNVHLEHVISQAECQRTQRLHLVHDYGNMLGSCTDDRPQVPKHCGAAKGQKPLHVTPYQLDCGAYFVFRGDGSIEASSDPAKRGPAEDTIRTLALDIRKLKRARAAAIRRVVDELTGRSPEDWHAEAGGLDVPDGTGRLQPFCFAIRQVLLRDA